MVGDRWRAEALVVGGGAETGGDRWRAEARVATPAELHARPFQAKGERLVTWCRPSKPALVLGSTQPCSVVDVAAVAAASIEVVRRRSGGGAVLVVPGDVFWVDLFIPRHDPLWDDDVVRSSHWVGEVWRHALERAGVPASMVPVAAPACSGWSRLACFAGTAAGEVEVRGCKVVGVCQRRSRDGAIFHCAALIAWRPEDLVRLLALDAPEGRDLVAHLAGSAIGIGPLIANGPASDAYPSDVETLLWEALVSSLPS